jgi:hypothetical protein
MALQGRMRAILSAAVFVMIGTAALVLAHPGENKSSPRASAPAANLRSTVAQHVLQDSAVR